jgi:uncharacterized protein YjbI with pentapeptide repeats
VQAIPAVSSVEEEEIDQKQYPYQVNLNGRELELLQKKSEIVPFTRNLKLFGMIKGNLYKLSWFPNLTSLDLSDTNIGNRMIPREDSDINLISILYSLKELNLSGCPIRDKDLKKISNLENLESLNISKTYITGSNLSVLNNCKNLKILDISGTNIFSANLQGLVLTDLVTFNVDDTFIDREAFDLFMLSMKDFSLNKK